MIGKGGGSRLPSFQLYDTRKYFPELSQRRVKYAKYPPRIHFFGPDSTVDDLWPGRPPVAAPAPPSDGLVNAARLSRRLQVLKLALEDLPRQARRMARWRVRRENMKSPKFKSPLRPGPPPGRRKRHIHQSMKSSPSATGSPAGRWSPTQAEAEIIRLRINFQA